MIPLGIVAAQDAGGGYDIQFGTTAGAGTPPAAWANRAAILTIGEGSPGTGTISKFEHMTHVGGPARFVVVNPSNLTVRSVSAEVTLPTGTSETTLGTPIAVTTGDVIGVYIPAGSNLEMSGRGGGSYSTQAPISGLNNPPVAGDVWSLELMDASTALGLKALGNVAAAPGEQTFGQHTGGTATAAASYQWRQSGGASMASPIRGRVTEVTIDLAVGGDIAVYSHAVHGIRTISETWTAPAGVSTRTLTRPIAIEAGEFLGFWFGTAGMTMRYRALTGGQTSNTTTPATKPGDFTTPSNVGNYANFALCYSAKVTNVPVQVVKNYTAPGSFRVPMDVTSVDRLQAVGVGGAGGNGVGLANGGAGGRAGDGVESTDIAVTPNAVHSITMPTVAPVPGTPATAAVAIGTLLVAASGANGLNNSSTNTTGKIGTSVGEVINEGGIGLGQSASGGGDGGDAGDAGDLLGGDGGVAPSTLPVAPGGAGAGGNGGVSPANGQSGTLGRARITYTTCCDPNP